MPAGAEAYCVLRRFPAAERARFCFDRHYLLYCTTGTMRLQAEGRVWSLPPSRAAFIAAGCAIDVTLPQAVTACSVLFHPDHCPAPAKALAVIGMTPLARELILACRQWTEVDRPLDPFARQLFSTLAAVVTGLARCPSRTDMPVPRSSAVAAAIRLTEQQLAEAPRFSAIAREVAVSERALARRFADEIGMTWRQALRRLRIIHAMDLLGTPGTTITATAYATGYTSLSAFNAAFLDVAGQTPTAFRAAVRSAPLAPL